MSSVIVYGDIHGCIDEFKALRKKVGIEKDDIEVSVGDFVNKGPNSIDTLYFMVDNEIKSVMGNNEVKLLKLYKRYLNEGEKLLKTIKKQDRKTVQNLTDAKVKYLENLPYFLKFSNITIVHGGVLPSMKLTKKLDNKMKKLITLLRYVNRDLEPISWDDEVNRYKYWSEVYKGHEGFVIYGHTPFEKPKIDEHAIGIDNGCVYGRKLVAVKFSQKKDGSYNTKNYKLFCVDAKKNYWDS